MAAEDLRIRWESAPTDMTVTNLASLASGTLWQSGEINDASPSHEILRISYELDFNATPVAGDSLRFYLAIGDEAAANEIWDGRLGTAEGQITAAASIAEAKQGCALVHEHAWATSHGVEFKGHFDVYNFGPSWQLLIEANGEALAAATNRVRRRYGTTQRQTA